VGDILLIQCAEVEMNKFTPQENYFVFECQKLYINFCQHWDKLTVNTLMSTPTRNQSGKPPLRKNRKSCWWLTPQSACFSLMSSLIYNRFEFAQIVCHCLRISATS